MNWQQGIDNLRGALTHAGISAGDDTFLNLLGWARQLAEISAKEARFAVLSNDDRVVRQSILRELDRLALAHTSHSFADLCAAQTHLNPLPAADPALRQTMRPPPPQAIRPRDPREAETPKQLDKILFVSADPSDASRLRIQMELREIQDELQRSPGRDGFHFELCLAARPSDLSRALLARPRPRILHFSGHGTAEGAICLEDDAGRIHAVSGAALASLLEPLSADLGCVILSACYARNQADAILSHVPYVVAMSNVFDDRAAIAYSVGFYQALFSGEDIPAAHRLGCAQIHMVMKGEHEKAVLLEAGRPPQV